mmetsp:Transcript_3114/g.8936  ORF Transcript_3114/g.8936 Transcript_3114/m.8936 type:complete len:417 (+) Transcript_3114:82-1332(+)
MVWECGGRDLERRRRAAVDHLHNLGRSTRASLLFAVRDNVKESACIDPDLSDRGRQFRRRLIDKVWEDVVLITEFKSAAALYEARAAADYQELASFGTPPTVGTPQWMRAKLLYCLYPFDRSLAGKLKDPLFLLLWVISLFPLYGVRFSFFVFLFILQVANWPADTYQIILFILTFKGTQFQSGGILLLVYAFAMYTMCIKPGDLQSCTQDGPGMFIPTWLHFLDILSSGFFCWFALMWVPSTRSHTGSLEQHSEIDDVNDLLLLGSDRSSETVVMPHHKEGGCCRTAGGRRVLKLLCVDFACLVVSVSIGAWMAFLDLANMATAAGSPSSDGFGGITRVMFEQYVDSPAGRAVAFKTRVLYNLMALPFMFFMIPTLGMVVSVTRETGYNRNGYCVPFTWRPVKQTNRSCRACATG